MTTATTSDSDSTAGHFQTLYRVARAVNSSLDVMQILGIIVNSTSEALGVKACSLRLLSPDCRRLFVGAACGLSANYRSKGPVDVANSGIDQIALSSEHPIYVADAGCDERLQYPEQMREEGIASLLVAPMRVQDRAIGVLRVYSGTPRAFSAADITLVEAIASLSALAIENGRLYELLDRDRRAALDFHERSFD